MCTFLSVHFSHCTLCFSHCVLSFQFMGAGVPGLPGHNVASRVRVAHRRGSDIVTLLHQSMEDSHVLEPEWRREYVMTLSAQVSQ